MEHRGILSGNALKIIAVIAMTLDHIGAYMFPGCAILRIIGRPAFPIFAYLIAEGCEYTKNRVKYIGNMLGLAIICQATYFIVSGSIMQCILVTFSLSIALVYLFDNAKNKKTMLSAFLFIAVVIAVAFITEILPGWATGFGVDYGLYGVLLPLCVYIGRNKWEKLAYAFMCLVFVSIPRGGVQWYSLAAIPLLALYNGKRGRFKMKSFFYIYYPLHLAIIYFTDIIINNLTMK